MRFAITLLTCDRYDYTQRTLDTLLAHNRLDGIVLLHGDDASTDARVPALARAAGFDTVLRPKARRGVAAMTEALIAAAARLPVGAVLNLQNDWECVRPIPWDELEWLFGHPEIYCVRLYGAMKSKTGRAGIHHGGRTPLTVVQWRAAALAGYEVAEIHWGHPPAVTRIARAVELTRGARTESDSRVRSGRMIELTARTVDNVFLHIGRERTVGFKA